MRFCVDVDDVSIERDKVVDALEVAMSYADKGQVGVTITDTSDGVRYPLQQFDVLLRKVLEV